MKNGKKNNAFNIPRRGKSHLNSVTCCGFLGSSGNHLKRNLEECEKQLQQIIEH